MVSAGGTERGNEVMAHLAAGLDLPLAANVTEVRPGDDDWELTRVRWGGSLLGERISHRSHQAVDDRPARGGRGNWRRAGRRRGLHPRACRPPEPDPGGRAGDQIRAGSASPPPRWWSAAAGEWAPPRDFGVLEELAGLLGGAVGCSRVVTNNGWRPHSDQVGQTGTRVAPNLYIACGISGAIQHWVGMMASKNVLAINNDAEAPMVTKSDYAVIGDLHPVLEAMVAEVKRRKGDY